MSDWFSASHDRQQQKLLDIVSEHQANKYLHTFMGIKNNLLSLFARRTNFSKPSPLSIYPLYNTYPPAT